VPSTRQNHRADAFARLFEAVHEGVYIGLLAENGVRGTTLAVRETLTLRSYDQRARNISVVTVLAAELPQVFADAYQIQQVLLNLVINAEQAMLSAHGRGSLTLCTRHDPARSSVILESPTMGQVCR
jgi:signal transduction histidine kinase